MVHLILTGATGLVGSSVLSHILSLPTGGNITRLSILTRNPTIPLLSSTPPPGTPRANKTTRIEVIEHRDFSKYPPELLERLQGADACIWALGVSQADVDKETYVRVTRDFAREAAKAFAGLRRKPTTTTATPTTTTKSGEAVANKKDALQGTTPTRTTTTTGVDFKGESGRGGDEKSTSDANKFKFIYVSGEGATQTPKPWTPLFGRVKGETEAALIALSKAHPYVSSLAVYSVRPAGVDGQLQPWLWRDILNNHRTPFQRIMVSSVMVPIRWTSRVGLAPGWHSPTDELSRVLVDMAVNESRGPYKAPGVDGEGRILSNIVLRRLAKDSKYGQ